MACTLHTVNLEQYFGLDVFLSVKPRNGCRTADDGAMKLIRDDWHFDTELCWKV